MLNFLLRGGNSLDALWDFSPRDDADMTWHEATVASDRQGVGSGLMLCQSSARWMAGARPCVLTLL